MALRSKAAQSCAGTYNTKMQKNAYECRHSTHFPDFVMPCTLKTAYTKKYLKTLNVKDRDIRGLMGNHKESKKENQANQTVCF